MPQSSTTLLSLVLVSLIAACGHEGHDHDHGPGGDPSHGDAAEGTDHDGDAAGHHDDADDHVDGDSHEAGHDHADGESHEGDEGHDAHSEEPLGSAKLGDLEVELAQGHGAVTPGKEAHLVVKLPYSDRGETIVRAWIGTPDRTLSYVGMGEYDADHDDYDIHATAPDPLPEGPKWWIEVEQPDGTKAVGFAEPILE